MAVIKRPTEPTHRLPGAEFTSLATPGRSDAATSVWVVRLAPGHGGLPHQLTAGETFVALDGQARVNLAGTAALLRAGDSLVVPPGVEFSIEADGDSAFEAVCVLPFGGQAVTAGGEPFTPPWAE